MVRRRAGQVRKLNAGLVECRQLHIQRLAAHQWHQRDPLHALRGGQACEFEQSRGDVHRAYDLGYLPRSTKPRIGDDDRNASREVADGRVALAPGLVLEEFESVVAEDDHDGVVGELRGVEISQDTRDLVVEIPYATIVEID